MNNEYNDQLYQDEKELLLDDIDISIENNTYFNELGDQLEFLGNQLLENESLEDNIQEYLFNPDSYREIGDVKKAYDDLFERTVPLKYELVVWRGTQGTAINTRGVISTTTNMAVAIRFLGKSFMDHVQASLSGDELCCMARIILPVGTRVLPLFHVSAINEYEILLPSNTIFDYVDSEVVVLSPSIITEDGRDQYVQMPNYYRINTYIARN